MNAASTGVRVWKNPGGIFHNLVVFDGSVILYAKAEIDQLDAVAQAIESGQMPEGFAAKSISVSYVSKVVFNRHNESVNVRFGSDKGSKSQEFDFATAAERDDFARLVGGAKQWHAKEVEHNAFTAVVKPLIALLITSGATWLLFQAAQGIAANGDAEISGRKRGIKRLFVWALDLLGSTGVLIVGGLLVACMALWLFKRVKSPPVEVTYKPGG